MLAVCSPAAAMTAAGPDESSAPKVSAHDAPGAVALVSGEAAAVVYADA